MSQSIVILGGGTGGTIMANRLRRAYGRDDLSITVVDRNDRHFYQPGFLFIPFGLSSAEEIQKPRAKQLNGGIDFHQTEITRVSLTLRPTTSLFVLAPEAQ